MLGAATPSLCPWAFALKFNMICAWGRRALRTGTRAGRPFGAMRAVLEVGATARVNADHKPRSIGCHSGGATRSVNSVAKARTRASGSDAALEIH